MTTLKYIGPIVGGVVVLGLVGLAWFFFGYDREQGTTLEEGKGATDKTAISDANDGPRLEADVYPLYPDAEWGREQILEGGLVRVTSKPFTDITNIAAVAAPFTQYYHEKLTMAGWEVDPMREASGPGANISYYVKDGRFIVVGFESEFKVKHDNAPSECPCDVTLSLTSGEEAGGK